MSNGQKPLIEFKNIGIKFQNDYVFKNVNLSVYEGEKVLIYGKSGIGKSLLFKMLLGFVVPTEGTIHFDQVPLDSNTVWDIRQKMAYISQEVSIGTGQVEENLKAVFSYKANNEIEFAREKLCSLLA